MTRKEGDKHYQDQTVRLKIGKNYPWPVFPVKLAKNSLAGEGSGIFNFISYKNKTTDLQTVQRNLSDAERILEKTNSPAEITQYKAFKFFEETTNQMFLFFRNLPGNEDINELVETNTHHGYIHQRRLEKHLKEFFKKEPEFRRNPDLLFYTFSQLLSIRFHDVLELFPDGKNLHTEGSALLLLGFLNDNREKFDKILEKIGIDRPDNKTWSKIITSAFITCLYHSKPKLLNEVQNKINAKKSISINDFLTEEYSMNNLFSLLPKLDQKHESKPGLISFVYKGIIFLKKQKDRTVFTPEEAKNLIKSAKIFSAIDKLDSILPSELSTARTFITMKDSSRPFLRSLEEIVFDNNGSIKMEILQLPAHNPQCLRTVNKLKSKKQLDYLDEYYLRIALAEGSSSPDDFSRLLFETQRVDFPDDLPNWLKAGFKFALEEKGDFLLKMIPEYLTSGNTKAFQQVYFQAENGLLAEFLLKYGFGKEYIEGNVVFYSQLKNDEERFKYISETIETLNQMGIEPHNIFASIRALRQEYQQLQETLKTKEIKLKEANLINKAAGEKATKLLQIAIKKRQLPTKINSTVFTQSFTSYFSISPK